MSTDGEIQHPIGDLKWAYDASRSYSVSRAMACSIWSGSALKDARPDLLEPLESGLLCACEVGVPGQEGHRGRVRVKPSLPFVGE